MLACTVYYFFTKNHGLNLFPTISNVFHFLHCVKVDGMSGQGGLGGHVIFWISWAGPLALTLQKQQSDGVLSS